jgi:hypothetical protein
VFQLLFNYGITQEEATFHRALSGVLAIKRMVKRWVRKHRRRVSLGR